MICPKCNGRKYIELDKIGLLVTTCPDCNGTGEIDDTDSKTGQPDSTLGGGDSSESPKPQKPKRKRKARKRTK